MPDTTTDSPDQRRTTLIAYWAEKEAAAQAVADECKLMGRTVEYLDDAGVDLELRRRDGTR